MQCAWEGSMTFFFFFAASAGSFSEAVFSAAYVTAGRQCALLDVMVL